MTTATQPTADTSALATLKSRESLLASQILRAADALNAVASASPDNCLMQAMVIYRRAHEDALIRMKAVQRQVLGGAQALADEMDDFADLLGLALEGNASFGCGEAGDVDQLAADIATARLGSLDGAELRGRLAQAEPSPNGRHYPEFPCEREAGINVPQWQQIEEVLQEDVEVAKHAPGLPPGYVSMEEFAASIAGEAGEAPSPDEPCEHPRSVLVGYEGGAEQAQCLDCGETWQSRADGLEGKAQTDEMNAEADRDELPEEQTGEPVDPTDPGTQVEMAADAMANAACKPASPKGRQRKPRKGK